MSRGLARMSADRNQTSFRSALIHVIRGQSLRPFLTFAADCLMDHYYRAIKMVMELGQAVPRVAPRLGIVSRLRLPCALRDHHRRRDHRCHHLCRHGCTNIRPYCLCRSCYSPGVGRAARASADRLIFSVKQSISTQPIVRDSVVRRSGIDEDAVKGVVARRVVGNDSSGGAVG